MKKNNSSDKIETNTSSLSFGISSDELYNMLKTNDALFLLDIRNQNEYKSKHIQGSVLVSSYHKTDLGMVPNIENSNKTLVLICRNGTESSQYADILNKMGIKSNYLIGGIEGWNHSLYHPSYMIGEKFS